jgi:hypothetical protein
VRIAAACAVLVAAFVGALMVGKSGGEQKVDTPAAVKAIEAPAGNVSAPRLADTGNVPDLQKTPEAPSTSGTAATGTSQSSTSTQSTQSTGSTPPSTGGGGGTSPQVRGPG